MAATRVDRILRPRLEALATQFPAVTVTGPRQSGKSTLCRMAFPDHAYVNLEAPDVRARAIEDPRGFLAGLPDGAILDEIQRAPDLTSFLQPLIDEAPIPGRWILTGSQHGLLTGAVSQSLAGRNALLELLPLEQTELERFPHRQPGLWGRVHQGGFPAIAARGIDPTTWCDQYVTTYLERDIREIRAIGDFNAFRGFLRLVAGRSAQSLNLASLGGDAGVSAATVRAWLSVLEATYTIHQLPPVHATIRKRITKASKLHMLDTGVACALLRITTPTMLETHPLRGPLFESFVVAEFRKRLEAIEPTATLSHYRDQHGEEADLIVERADSTLVVEMKSGATTVPEWGRTVRRIAERLRESGRTDVRPVVVHGGDLATVIHDVAFTPWWAIDTLVPA